LELPDSFQSKVEAPSVGGKPLVDLVDQPDRVLAALIDWRASVPLEAPAEDSRPLSII
jgi:hypothetical protein